MSDQLEIYFNTTNLQGRELKGRVMRVGTQNNIILTHFKLRPSQVFTPCEVWIALKMIKRIGNNVPITSIRRSITTLTDLGFLVKTDVKRPGIYGEKNYCWKLNC